MVEMLSERKTASPFLYLHSSRVPRKVDMKLNVTLSPAGVRSGNSGREKVTQEWTSARLKLPVSVRVLNGLQHAPHAGINNRRFHQQWNRAIQITFDKYFFHEYCTFANYFSMNTP